LVAIHIPIHPARPEARVPTINPMVVGRPVLGMRYNTTATTTAKMDRLRNSRDIKVFAPAWMSRESSCTRSFPASWRKM
jgi:hypothetical protein